MRIAVIGAGGVGGPFGAALHRSGHDVWFLARGRHLAALRECGLRVVGARGDSGALQVKATDRPGEIGPVRLVLLAVKLWDVEGTIGTLGPIIGPDTVVVTLQNGVDAPDHVASRIGARHVAAGACFVNASMAEPGVIVQYAATQQIVAGMLDGAPSAALAHFGEACSGAGIGFQLTDTPVDLLWEKFIQLVPLSATTTLLRGSVGLVRDDLDQWTLFMQILEETVLVGRATGARIPSETIERRLEYVRNMPYHATTSMAKDLLGGRRLELPWLSGRVVELGRLHGIATPANDFIRIALKPFAGGAEPRAV